MKKLLFFGELPPKVTHGVSISNKRVLSDLNGTFDIIEIEDDSSFKSGGVTLINILKSLFKLFNLKQCKIDVLYLNCPTSVFGLLKNLIFIFSVRMKWRDVCIISHLHRGDINIFLNGFFSKKIFDLYYFVIDRLLVLSNSVVKDLISYGYNVGNVSVLYNTVDEDFFLDTDSNYSFSAEYYLSLSNYIETKNLDVILYYFGSNPNLVLHCHGGGRGNYFYRLKTEFFGNNIIVGGPIYFHEKRCKVKNAKAMLISSKNEGMPLIILEALSLGTPVICYDVGCIKEYLGSDYPGLVSELTDEAFFQKISWLDSLSSDEYLSLRLTSKNVFWNKFSPKDIKVETIRKFVE
ncbi:TPA: glycosyltransferase [Aeromonas salmonicida]|nr:glycosyltransferase [Aeromonas salmonicida]